MLYKLLPLLFLVAACGTTTTTGPEGEEGGLNGAWQKFRNGQYTSALADFQQLAVGALFPEATQGQAWCQLMLAEPEHAVLSFQRSLQADDEQTAALAGEAFSLRDTGNPNYSRLLSRARTVLNQQPDFVFEHRTSINWQDLHILMAQAFFYRQQFDSTLSHLQSVDPALAISAEDSLSWQGGASFQSAVFAELLRLGALTAE